MCWGEGAGRGSEGPGEGGRAAPAGPHGTAVSAEGGRRPKSGVDECVSVGNGESTPCCAAMHLRMSHSANTGWYGVCGSVLECESLDGLESRSEGGEEDGGIGAVGREGSL